MRKQFHGGREEHANRGNAAAYDGASKTVAKLKPVEGATIGSVSYYVEDRKVWKDFVHCFQNRTKNHPQITNKCWRDNIHRRLLCYNKEKEK